MIRKVDGVLMNNKQAGLSLVELMVSITIGLILIAGTIQIYVNSKQTYRVQNANSRVQENARFALNTLTSNLRQAGFVGCANLNKVTPKIVASPKPTFPDDLTAASAVKGSEYTGSSWTPAVPTGVLGVVANTDVITVQYAKGCGASLTGNLASKSSDIKVTAPNSCGLKKDTIVMISDCEKADIFSVTNDAGESGGEQTLAHAALSKEYQADAEVYVFNSSTYFISNNPAGIPSLYIKDHAQNTDAVELIEGVENLQVTYGLDDGNDGVPDRYVAANTVETAARWDHVVSLRLRMLLRTTDNVQASNFTDTDTTVSSFGTSAYSGGFMRKVFTTTIQLRNRSLVL